MEPTDGGGLDLPVWDPASLAAMAASAAAAGDGDSSATAATHSTEDSAFRAAKKLRFCSTYRAADCVSGPSPGSRLCLASAGRCVTSGSPDPASKTIARREHTLQYLRSLQRPSTAEAAAAKQLFSLTLRA